MNDSNETPGAASAQNPRKAPAQPPRTPKEPQPMATAVTVVVKATRTGVTIAGARVAKGHPIHVTKEVAEFHESRGEVVIVGTAG